MENSVEALQPSTPPADLTASLPETPPKKNHKKWIVLLGIILFMIIALSVTWPKLFGSSISLSQMTQSSMEEPSPTTMPFRELTIPYLRSREYKSTLSQPELLSNNGSYTSYLTSYDSDGNKINALLTIPTGEKPSGGWPAIIFIHGYIPPTLYQTVGPQYADYVDYLARNGFVVLKIDLRGHGQSEGEAGGGYYGSDYVVDALNAYAALQSDGEVNPKKIGMWGHSMAGNILMRSLATRTDIPAIVIWAGAVYSYEDMRKYGIDDNSYRPPTSVTRTQQRRRELFEKQGSPSATSIFWQQVAPTNYLSDIKGAIEIHHAVDDTVVNVGYSRDLMALLDKTSVEHTLYEYETGGHNISGSSFVTAMQRTVDFFRKHLGT